MNTTRNKAISPVWYAAIRMAKLINKEAKKHTTAKTEIEKKNNKLHKKIEEV